MRSFVILLLLVFMSNQSASAAGYSLKQGKGYAICEAFKKRLDQLGSLKEPINDTKRIIWEIPGIAGAAWQDLDLETHGNLFEKLIRYNMQPGNEMGEMRVKERVALSRADAKAGKAKLQVLRANIELYDDAPEIIARVWEKYGDGPYEYFVIMYPVTEDLKEIDEAKKNRAAWLASGDIVMYGGELYLVEWNRGSWVSIEKDFGRGLV